MRSLHVSTSASSDSSYLPCTPAPAICSMYGTSVNLSVQFLCQRYCWRCDECKPFWSAVVRALADNLDVRPELTSIPSLNHTATSCGCPCKLSLISSCRPQLSRHLMHSLHECLELLGHMRGLHTPPQICDQWLGSEPSQHTSHLLPNHRLPSVERPWVQIPLNSRPLDPLCPLCRVYRPVEA